MSVNTLQSDNVIKCTVLTWNERVQIKHSDQEIISNGDFLKRKTTLQIALTRRVTRGRFKTDTALTVERNVLTVCDVTQLA